MKTLSHYEISCQKHYKRLCCWTHFWFQVSFNPPFKKLLLVRLDSLKMNFYKFIKQDFLQAECPSAKHQHQIIQVQGLYIALKLLNLITLSDSELELYLVCDVEPLLLLLQIFQCRMKYAE